MTGAPLSPERWAIDISLMLNTVLGKERFPVDVALVAKEIQCAEISGRAGVARHRSALARVRWSALPRAGQQKRAGGFFTTAQIASSGRINFTLGHEFGHYLIHRTAYPGGIRCGEQDVVRWDSEYGQIEHQAKLFSSARILMPLDDFRRQIAEGDKVDLDVISHCANRYRVSLIAAVLRWLQYTSRRAVLVLGAMAISCGRASQPALRTGAFFRTSGPPVAIPGDSRSTSSGHDC